VSANKQAARGPGDERSQNKALCAARERPGRKCLIRGERNEISLFVVRERRGEEIHSVAQDKTPLLGIRAALFFTPRRVVCEKSQFAGKNEIRIDVCNQAARHALDIFMNRITAL
jgi:hypothetical protein